ncbi:ABC transporter permease [Paenibacillus koleovorans]|uniref:ABC transporter permease n=1 Tax=Paenibacillus koleovorans TaxID=121608 RepID=UPI000FD8F3A5|nr:ABC transporter permease subunit [Paenibacillus koleovorans]
MNNETSTVQPRVSQTRAFDIPFLRYLWKHRLLYLLSIPGIAYFILFKYIPMGGVVIAFQQFNIFKGISGSPWVGLDNFERMFAYMEFARILKNTLLLAFYDLLFGFPAPIIAALLLNELRSMAFKRIVQTAIYMPHFLSWVIIGGISLAVFGQEHGLINHVRDWLGLERLYFLGDESYIRSILVGTGIWRDMGWGTIIYLAAITGIHPDLYEAAEIDGASRWKQTLSITIPALLPTITILFLLQIGHFLDFGFERVYVFLNSLNQSAGDTLDTYIYRLGLLQQQFSYTTAIGVFKSVVGLVLLYIGNWLSRKSTGEGLF